MGLPQLPPQVNSRGPTGLNLYPSPPGGKHLSRRAGILCAAALTVLLGLVAYGILELNSPGRRARAAAPEQLAAASPIALEGAPGGTRSTPLKAPPPLTLPNSAMPLEQQPGAAKTFALAPPTPPQVPSPPYAAPSVAPTESPEVEAERRAVQAPASVQWATTPSGAVGQYGGYPPPPGGLLQPIGREQNQQDEKQRFAADHQASAPVNATRQPPATRFVVAAGWRIPATLETEVQSDLPGKATAIAREHVFDTATGKYLLVPQGARFVGRYNSRVSYGQNAAQVIWDRIVFPDASSVELEGMDGIDTIGRTGFHDKVDNHYKRLLLSGGLMSLITASFSLSQSRRGTTFGYPSAAEVAGTAAGQQVAQLGTEMTQRNLNIQPTIQIRPGYRFDIFVSRDLVFAEPYSPN